MHFLLIVLKKGQVIDVVCCANGTDSSHKLVQEKDYQVLGIDKMRLDKADWLTPKVYKGEAKDEEDNL